MTDYPVIQNMARFYAYDLSRECGFLSPDWAMPSNGLYECFDLKNYFEDESRRAYLVRVENELAGFVLLNQIGTDTRTDWNIGEFFILAKFQRKGVGRNIAKKIWDQHPGIWEVAVIPENRTALAFWHKAIGHYMLEHYQFETKLARKGQEQPYRVIFTFDTQLRAEKLIPISNTPKITGLNVAPDHADIHFLTLKINEETPKYGAAYPFGFFIRDEMNQIIAGCNGSAIYGVIYTDQLWVALNHRKSGLGRKLMEQVHDYGREADCKMATVTTMDFQQARSFYEKLGYKCDFERSGYVKNSMCYFLKKPL